MVKGSIKYQDLIDQGLIITPKADYERAQVDMQILAFENQKYKHALEKIANGPATEDSEAEHYKNIARWSLWNFSNVTRKTYKALDPSIAERASAAFAGQEAHQSFDSTQYQDDASVASDAGQGAND